MKNIAYTLRDERRGTPLLHRETQEMLRTPNELPTRRRILAVARLAAGMFLLADVARAEIIIDDFVNPAEVAETSSGASPLYAITERVGDLLATREMGILTLLTNPIASFDSDISVPSKLSAKLDGHTIERPPQTTIISFVNAYSFSPRDLTEGGTNDAMLFDFQSHAGTEQPNLFRVIASAPSSSGTSTDIYVAHASDFQFSVDPFTIVIPFSRFTLRDGTPNTPDFSRLTRLNVNFYFLRPSENIEWSIEIDRIRIGRTPIPEPSSGWLGFVSLWTLVCVPRRGCYSRRFQRRISRCQGPAFIASLAC